MRMCKAVKTAPREGARGKSSGNVERAGGVSIKFSMRWHLCGYAVWHLCGYEQRRREDPPLLAPARTFVLARWSKGDALEGAGVKADGSGLGSGIRFDQGIFKVERCVMGGGAPAFRLKPLHFISTCPR